MKWIQRCLLLSLFLTAVLSAADLPRKETAAPGKLKVGLFVGKGARGGGVFHWARLMAYSPGITLSFLDGADIRNGKLAGVDVLIIPGGSSEHEYLEIQESGGEKIREFVRNGGKYVGICAGFHCSLNHKKRFRLLPYRYYRPAVGRSAVVAVEFTKAGAERLGIKPGGLRWVTYASGPIAQPDPKGPEAQVEELAFYRSSVTRVDNSKNSFSGFPGALFGRVGKGLVMVTSFHPEYRECYAVSGLKTAPVYPRKNRRPLRVVMYVSAIAGKEPVRRMFELDKHPDIDVVFANKSMIGEGVLRHCDVFFVPDGEDDWFASFYKASGKRIRTFEKNGGVILVSGKGEAEILKEHKKVIFVSENISAAEAALKR